MTTPVTALDPRYSDPAAAAITWRETREALEKAELSWISTVRPDGRPHVTPLVGGTRASPANGRPDCVGCGA